MSRKIRKIENIFLKCQVTNKQVKIKAVLLASIQVHTHYIRENDLGTYGSAVFLEWSVEPAFDFVIILAASSSNSSNS